MARQKFVKVLSLAVSVLLFGGVVALLESRILFKDFDRKPASTKPTLRELTDDEAFKMVIKGKLAEVQRCYDRQLRQGLKKSGNLIVKWYVDSNGVSGEFEEEENELGSVELFDCTTTAISSWEFPKNRPIQIRYTFKMRALEKEKIIRQISTLEE